MIGVYDSGYGGLTVLRALRAVLPEYDFVYLGDSGRAPYGGRSGETLLDFAEQCVERLFEEGCSLIVVACHTMSCVALQHLQHRYAPLPAPARRLLGVTIPAAQAAVAASAGHIGVLGTERTIASGTFGIEIAKLGPHRVSGRAAPLLAPLVEEGWEDSDLARGAVERYVRGLGDIDTLVLACTHYPLLLPAFRAVLGSSVQLLDPSPHVAVRLLDWLARHPGFVAPGTGRLRALCSGDPAVFAQHAERFLGAPLPAVQHIAEEAGRLAHRERPVVPRGQLVRQQRGSGAARR
jgi:glutamate racemase